MYYLNKERQYMAKFKQKIVIYGRYRSANQELMDTVKHLYDHLKAKVSYIGIEAETAKHLNNFDGEVVEPETLKDMNLMIVIGGDGSILTAGLTSIDYGIPIIGINRGRLGFLADISPKHAEHDIEQILAGNYKAESRFILESTILDDKDQVVYKQKALNDVVLLPGDNAAQMIEFSILIDNELVCSQRADGLIVATPTGSTAYALSGGGPILHPALDAIVLVPMFPHTLTSRPIVIDANSTIQIMVTSNDDSVPKISCDGHTKIPIYPNQSLTIQKGEKKLMLLHPTHYNYYETLRTKLGWQQKH